MLREQRDNIDESSVDMYIFFLGENVFQNSRWIRNFPFWRFQTYLFPTRYHNVEKTPELLHDANNLVLPDISAQQLMYKDEYDDCFKNLPHFEKVLNKFIQLEDSDLLQQFIQICHKHSDYNKLSPLLLKAGISPTILNKSLKDFFNQDNIQDGEKFLHNLYDFGSHVKAFTFYGDKDTAEIYYEVFTSILERYEEMVEDEDDYAEQYVMDYLAEFFRISEKMGYNLFNFMKYRPPNVVQAGLFGCTLDPVEFELGVVFIRPVTDLYSCTRLFDDWTKEYENCLEEVRFLTYFFQLVEKVGADIKGLLGDVKKYRNLVAALSEVSNLESVDDSEDGALPKFWVPFATSLAARIEILLDSEGNKTGHDGYLGSVGNNFGEGLYVGRYTLDEINKLLLSAKRT
ncbi:uncharacterized protein LOC118437819 isoform X1 [Folsomia candida]|uniref:uncharacterized protein LOC118437819 isoform X1 n=1 Tax=Folsomia candida TaxID=158441 RepID=UPI00160539BA|nr:uncharacterized protein LOC118437819 isoform X1 [Folsomia candida]